VVLPIDLEGLGLDSADIILALEKEDVRSAFRKGMMEEIKEGKLISEKKIGVSGFPALEYCVNMGPVEKYPLNYMYARNIFVGTTMYSFITYTTEEKQEEELRNHFFGSFSFL
jgi:hypothetical protein